MEMNQIKSKNQEKYQIKLNNMNPFYTIIEAINNNLINDV